MHNPIDIDITSAPLGFQTPGQAPSKSGSLTQARRDQLKAECDAFEAEATAREKQERLFFIQNRDCFLHLGQQMLGMHQRSTFRQSGVIAGIMACIVGGGDTRDEIVRTVPRHHSCSYAEVGFVLGKLAGTDPTQHLWFKGQDGLYRLHQEASGSELKLAA